MRLLDDELILATGDLTKFVRCGYATFVDHGSKKGTLQPLAFRPRSAMTDLIVNKGEEHEHAYVESLRAAGREIVTVGKPAWSIEALRRAERDTLAAMQRGVEIIHQAAFFDGRWSGYADLLERVDVPSALGDWSYEVADLKLARGVRAYFLLQLSDYSEHVARLQGRAPTSMHVILGTRERVSFDVAEVSAYYRHVRGSLDDFIARALPPAPYPVEFCTLCDWSAHCWKHWNDGDHLALVANIRRTQVSRLERGGIGTLTALGEAPARLKIRKIAETTFATLSHQARLQLQHRRTGKHTFELLPIEAERGFLRLPRPSPGDLYLDVEGDPFLGEGLTYLFGAAWEENGETRYRAWWSHDSDGERAAFESVMDFIAERRAADPDAHIHHYGHLEVATLQRLMGRFGTRERELDDLLRREAFVDLAAVVRQAMRISHPGYGLKKVETFYYERESEGVADAGGAVLAYEQWLESNDPKMLEEIERYNAEDCFSIVEMRRWLSSIRPPELAWKEPPELQAPRTDRQEEDLQSDALAQRLLAEVPHDVATRTPEQHARWRLANLVVYHRREERPAWWAYFERQRMTPDQLLDDSESIAALTVDESAPPVDDKRSKIFTYRYPPQEHKFDPGDNAFDARTGEKAGEIVQLDDAAGVLRLKRGPKSLLLRHADGLIPKPEFDSAKVREAIRRFATSALEQDNAYRAGRDILLNRAPRIAGIDTGATIQRDDIDATILTDLVRRLDDSYLFIQGPPGSGKTYDGARVIVALLREGKRIGVTSNSHAAIHNLLDEVEKVAEEEGFRFRGLKKGTDDKRFVSKLAEAMIESTAETSDCADPAIPLVAGTAWLFADEAMEQSLDHLFIDEAGQVSLANAIAVATAARNLVLLGDPLQLAQVSQGSHPEGAGVSVLEHLLGKHATVPPDRGIFLPHTWRMHPAVCGFVSEVVYDSRLHSAPKCARQAVTIDGVVENGLRFVPIEHEGNSQSSEEEAEWIAGEIARMLRGEFTNVDGETRPLEQRDFLVVAAYNAQVRHLTHALAQANLGEVPVGTVDKFQGRQAPVVFFSMATSSGADLPRDIDFLFSRNRLNVAISRARCVAMIVASPRLLDVACRTPEQMALASGLCRFIEHARKSPRLGA